jgi:hypothetical protein
MRLPDCRDVSYSIHINFSRNIFGCIGLKNKEFCIFNKQYSEEEYKILVEKIIEHMEKIGEWGEFFPMELSMFPYNDTIAQEFFPMTKEEVLKKGLRWQDEEEKNYKITIRPEDLPDDIKDVKDEIMKEVIGCAHAGSCSHGCATAFKITTVELEFYRRMNLPLPRFCYNCRHYARFGKLNPLKLWHRKCMKEGCTNEFETSYSPDRPEIVYCERCYQQEVY